MSGSLLYRVKSERVRTVISFLSWRCLTNSILTLLSVALRNEKRAQKCAIEWFAKRTFPRAIILDNGRARDNPCKYAKASNCKQSNLNVTLAEDVYISHCTVSLLRVCAADKGDGVSSENAFRNDDTLRLHASQRITLLREVVWLKKKKKENNLYLSLPIHIHKSYSSINHAGDFLPFKLYKKREKKKRETKSNQVWNEI